MATRKEARKKSLLQVLALIIALVIIVVAVVIGQRWWQDRSSNKSPANTTVTVSYGNQKQQIHPYLVQEPGTKANEGEVPSIQVNDSDTVTVDLPGNVYDHDWSAVLIYDNPAANDEQRHGPREAKSVSVPVQSEKKEKPEDPKPKLMVIEIQSVMLGKNDKGDETPYTTIWSVSTQYAKPGDQKGN